MIRIVAVAILLVLTLPIRSAAADELAVDLELVLAVDASGSVNRSEFALQLNGIAAGLRDEQVLQAVRSGPNGRIAVNLLVWAEARYPKESTGWMIIGSPVEAQAAAERIANFPRHATGGTGLGDGLASALRSFADNQLAGLRQVVDVSGDGRETTPREFAIRIPQAREMARRLGVTVNGLAILTDDARLAEYYRSDLQTGTGSFVMSVANYDDFAQAMRRKLLREITYRPKISLAGD